MTQATIKLKGMEIFHEKSGVRYTKVYSQAKKLQRNCLSELNFTENI